LKNKKPSGILDWIELLGRKLPHPVVLFILLIGITILVSELIFQTGLTVEYTEFSSNNVVEVQANSLLSREGINYIFNSAVNNFVTFAPLGTVLTAMLGVGVAESSGLIAAAMKRLLTNVPSAFLSAAVVFVGIMSNVAADTGFVVVVPLGAIIFAAAGRNPIVGLAAAFAGVSAGFSANLLIGPTDANLVGTTNEVLQSSGIDYEVAVTANWFFMGVAAILLTTIGAVITDKVIEPRLGEYQGNYVADDKPLTQTEHKGLRNALIALIIYVIIMGLLMFPENALLKTMDEAGEMTLSNFLSNGLLFAIFLLFVIPGLTYGITTKSIQNSNDFVEGMSESMKSMSGFLVIAFFAAQMIDYFGYTNLGTMMAVSGANALQSINFVGLPLLIGFILVCAFINLFIGSANAKWALLAPVFVPMMLNLDVQPEVTLAAYRIADSSTNIITPMLNYFGMILIFFQRYDKKSNMGTVLSTMVPYSGAFLISFTLLFAIWYLIGLPFGVY